MPEDRYRDQPPFRASAVLHDGTRLIIRRNGGLEPVRTQTTHTLDGSGASTHIWECLQRGALHTRATEAGRIGWCAAAGPHELIMRHYYSADQLWNLIKSDHSKRSWRKAADRLRALCPGSCDGTTSGIATGRARACRIERITLPDVGAHCRPVSNRSAAASSVWARLRMRSATTAS
jgi:hypothetical protein